MSLGLARGSRVPDLETTALRNSAEIVRGLRAPFVFDAGRELRHVDD
jgi:hypothetical protein